MTMPVETSTTPPSRILDAALEYLDMGFSVLPVRRENKKPYLERWRELQERPATAEEVEGWWKLWPDANVAIICGRISGIFCVDADGPEGMDWVGRNLPLTSVYSKTARGLHAIYAVAEHAVIRNKVSLAPKVDIRGEGGYFVAPPSVHETGHVYHWVFPPGGDGWEGLTAYAPAYPGKAPSGPGNLNLDLSGTSVSPTLVPVSKGARNQTLAQLSGRWVAKGLDLDEVLLLARGVERTQRSASGGFGTRAHRQVHL